MLGSVPVTHKALDDYRAVVGDERIDEIRELAAPLAGKRVLHLNATSFGGGVAEILTTLVPLMNDAGLIADWQVIPGADDFYQVTKAMHNSLQGMYVDWTPEKREIWLSHNRRTAEQFDQTYDFVIVHDPQPAAVLAFLRELDPARTSGKWIWRCHIDLTEAQVQTWDLLLPYVNEFDGAIFTASEYVRDNLTGPRLFTVPPAIDPLSPKNVDLPDETYRAILERYGLDTNRPFIAQISRFDPWKDPLGVIEVYRLLKRTFGDLQLVLVASMAHDDPEGWAWYERAVRRAGEDYDIHILSNLNGVGNVEVNAFQRAQVVIQKSVREGFGLVVSEALWKRRPVVAGKVGGIPLQLLDGETGYLVSTTEECAEQVGVLLADPELANQMGAAGREFVRERFLITRYLRDYLRMFHTLHGDEVGMATPPSGQEEA
ncbi:MAG: glycosyltransferase [Chloroflexi bacterium]|nr:glycosyltransferase [Chloroflexota bacterium]